MTNRSRPDFENTTIAFAERSDAELARAHWLFWLMNKSWLVKAGGRLAEWALRWGLPVEGLVKNTIYGQFCGGESIGEVRLVIERLDRHGIKTILDYGVEGKETEEDFNRTADYLAQTLRYAEADAAIHIISTKLSGLFRFELLARISAGESLSAAERDEWERGRRRVDRICEAAFRAGIGLHIDAEESWIQGAVDQIAWDMSARYNRGKATVINAVQLYRKDRLQFLHDSFEHARDNHYLCAVKLVRGAYMEKERRRAAEMGYPSPIHDTIEGTHRAYNDGLRFCLDRVDELYVCNATHNENSVRLQVRLMEERNLPPDHPHVATAQLYGMGDHLSFNMARAGYNVEKYLPYGPVREVIPYLLRRTEENTSVGGQMSRELGLLRKEIKRRKS